MTTPRLQLVQHLGLATAHASRTDPAWLEECGAELARAFVALQDARGGAVDPVLAAMATGLNQGPAPAGTSGSKPPGARLDTSGARHIEGEG